MLKSTVQVYSFFSIYNILLHDFFVQSLISEYFAIVMRIIGLISLIK